MKALIPGLPLTSCVNLSKLLNFSMPQFSHLPNMDNNSNFLMELKGFNDAISIKSQEQCLAHRKHCISLVK